jgi:hypothetical protein
VYCDIGGVYKRRERDLMSVKYVCELNVWADLWGKKTAGKRRHKKYVYFVNAIDVAQTI